MRGTGIVTKLSKLDVSRIALCKSPADQDAVFVVVKSEDIPAEEAQKEEATVPAGDPVAEEAPEDAPAVEPQDKPEVAKEDDVAEIKEPFAPGLIFKTNRRLSEPQLKAAIEEIRKQWSESVSTVGSPILLPEGIEVALASSVKEETATVVKSPVPSEQRTEEFSTAPADDGMKECIKGLVDKCNESRAVPKGVLKMIGEVAKYHGVEGPDMEGEDAFAEVTAQLRAVVDILKGLAITIAKPAPAAPETPAAPAPAKPKPAPTKKSRSEIYKEKLEEIRFDLLRGLGKDPCPPGK